MILSYTSVFDGITQTTEAKITTNHSCSSYGQPVIILNDGQLLDANSFVLSNYKLFKATKKEQRLFQKWCDSVTHRRQYE